MSVARAAAVLVAVTATAHAGDGRAQLRDEAARSEPANGGDVVVTGRRDRRDRSLADTRAIARVQDGQLARFETPVCPLVIGLPPLPAAAVAARIRVVARRADIRVGAPGCAPNLTVAVAQDGAAFVDRLHRRRPALFATLSRSAVTTLLTGRGPCRSWQVVSPKRRDGGPVEMISQLQLGSGPPHPAARGAFIATNVTMSRLSVPVRQDTDLAFVVLDASSTSGLTLGQIADYAAMASLAPLRTDRADALGRSSILTIFDDAAAGRVPPTGATAFDIAYLSSLYAGEPGVSADQKTMMMAGQIRRSVEP